MDFIPFQNLACHEYNEVLHKDAAIMIIKVRPKNPLFKVTVKVAGSELIVLQGVLDAEQSNFKGTAEAS